MKDLVDILGEAGYTVVVGQENVFEAIIDMAAGISTGKLCSGYGVFPDGSKCNGCSDCGSTAERGAAWADSAWLQDMKLISRFLEVLKWSKNRL